MYCTNGAHRARQIDFIDGKNRPNLALVLMFLKSWLVMGRLKQASAMLLLLVLVVMASLSRAFRVPESNQLRMAQEQISSGALNTYYFEARQPQVEVLPPDHSLSEGTTRLRAPCARIKWGSRCPL